MDEDIIKENIKSLSIGELVDYEKATRLLCIKYENSFKNYDGTFQQNYFPEEYKMFERYNKVHTFILDEFEERIKKLGLENEKSKK